MYIGPYCSLMWLKSGIALYPVVSVPYKTLELFPSKSFNMLASGKEQIRPWKKFVLGIPIYNVIVTGSTVMESWDDGGGEEILVSYL